MPRDEASPLCRPVPRSIDMVRVIRRCVRCFIFGAIGMIPLAGVGLAIQALRLRRQVEADLGQPKRGSIVWVYWIAGLLLMWVIDGFYGWLGDLTVCVALVLMQSWYVWHALAPRERPGHPGWRPLAWGVTFAYAGLSGSVWTVALGTVRVARLAQAL